MKSIELYMALLAKTSGVMREFTKNFLLHKTQFTFDRFNEECYLKMYKDLKNVVSRKELFSKIPGLKEACASCWKFYLLQRTKSLKSLDIKLGKQFENVFIDFLDSIGIKCNAEMPKVSYPDIAVLNSQGERTAYFELKYLTAPFVKVYEKVPGRECYEGSTTLDVGKKILAQRKVVEEEINVPVFYVYWLDYPCIKGVFYMSAKKVYAYIDKVKIEWTRKLREGNFVRFKNKRRLVGTVEKVYLPLLEMGNFEEFIKELRLIGA